MTAFYSVLGHSQLSAAAATLAGPALDAIAEAAERLQDLRTCKRYRGDQAETAKLVVVYQINKMLAEGAVLSPVASVGRGARSVSYRVESSGRSFTLDERASLLREDLREWAPLITKR